MKRLFISQPMRDKTDEEILAVRKKAAASAERILCEKVEVIDSFFLDEPKAKNRPLAYLAMSLLLMSYADVVYFAKDWEQYRGCRIENRCATEYGITVIEDYSEDEKRRSE